MQNLSELCVLVKHKSVICTENFYSVKTHEFHCEPLLSYLSAQSVIICMCQFVYMRVCLCGFMGGCMCVSFCWVCNLSMHLTVI